VNIEIKRQLKLCVFLQIMDVITTLVGIHFGAHEMNPLIRFGYGGGVFVGLLAGKIAAALIVAALLAAGRNLFKANLLFSFVVLWNVGIITVKLFKIA
jgi:hypothetical protein